jgi:hypothetical protein
MAKVSLLRVAGELRTSPREPLTWHSDQVMIALQYEIYVLRRADRWIKLDPLR